MQRRDGRLLPILVIAASVASITATVVLAFYGIYFFIFFVLAFGLPWSVKKLWRNRARKQWNVEDMR
jgi:hypothetical protein